jgi:hypothetical protein
MRNRVIKIIYFSTLGFLLVIGLVLFFTVEICAEPPHYYDINDPNDVVLNSDFIMIAKPINNGYHVGTTKNVFKIDSDVIYIQDKLNRPKTGKIAIIDGRYRFGIINTIRKEVKGNYCLLIGRYDSSKKKEKYLSIYNHVVIEGFDPSKSILEQSDSVKEIYMTYYDIINGNSLN